MNILGIETSCDETAAAVVKDGVVVLAQAMASSADIHQKYGGVVPEVAARKQVESIIPVLNETLEKFTGTTTSSQIIQKAQINIDAIAITVGPGLIGSLVVGVEAAKALALAWNKPLIPVNHLVGHIYGNFVGKEVDGLPNFPAVVLIVSGGHTDLILMKNHGDFEYLGGTLDDAAGEAFDKTARLLGISKYLGGSALSKLAKQAIEKKYKGKLPRPMIGENNFDFSFSGLKTAVKRLVEQEGLENLQKSATADIAAIAHEFENAVVDVLVKKTIKAAQKYCVKNIMLAGGVAANKTLRDRLQVAAQETGITLFVPPLELCTDNAIYIASAAFYNNKPKALIDVKADSSLKIMD